MYEREARSFWIKKDLVETSNFERTFRRLGQSRGVDLFYWKTRVLRETPAITRMPSRTVQFLMVT